MARQQPPLPLVTPETADRAAAAAAVAAENAYDTALGRFVLRRASGYDTMRIASRRQHHLRRAQEVENEDAKAQGREPFTLDWDEYADRVAQAMATVEVLAVAKPATLDFNDDVHTALVDLMQRHWGWTNSFRGPSDGESAAAAGAGGDRDAGVDGPPEV